MFENFEKMKGQLAELAEVINRFKSEAVQLRLLEILLGKTQPGDPATQDNEEKPTPRRRGRRKSKAPTERTESGATKKKRSVSSGAGAVATLAKTFQEGFFSQPRTIGDICAHCETNHARRIKPNEISGKLGRMVRERQLSRTKNSEGQYVYTKA
ncbi:MAG: hypothetical protein ABI988_17790 [Nitrospirota bacterium]